MEFQILGSLEVSEGGTSVYVAGVRQRKLLALLLVNADHAVSLESLVDALWDEDPPATAKRQIQNCVSALRRLLGTRSASSDEPEGFQISDEAGSGEPGRPRIVSEGNAYRLELGTGRLDARVFQDQIEYAQALSSTNQTRQAAAELRAALRLWRGPALAGLTGRALEAAAGRLDERRRAAAEHCVELELRLGRHTELIGELTELVSGYPLRERLVAQLMLALYRSGRQADALETYRSLRSRLADELGIEPGTEVQELHTAILKNETGLDLRAGEVESGAPAAGATAVTAVPAQLPTDVAGFTGREEQLKELDRTLSADPAGGAQVTICAITGTAGVGKTALAVHWAQRARKRFPDGQLYVNLRGFDPSAPAVDASDALRGFLDALGIAPDRIPIDLPARSALYRSLLADRRMLVVLDNVRDADQVRPLLPGSPTCPVVSTSRDLLSGLVAAEGARPMSLDLLTAAEARQLLAARLGQERVDSDPQATNEIITRCARLPLALAVVAARAAGHPRFPLTMIAAELDAARSNLNAFAGRDRATDVRAVFSWSYQQLGEPARRLFRLLALQPGSDVTVPAAGSLAAVEAEQARGLVAELAGASLVIEHLPGRFAFHDLQRAYASELVHSCDPVEERHAALHRLLGHYLHTACAADRHLDPYRDPISVAPLEPGVAAEPITGHEHAMNWFAAEHAGLVVAVERAAEAGFGVQAWQLAWSLAYFFERQGLWQPWCASQHTALRAARRLADRTGQAHAHRSLGRAHVHLGRDDEALEHLGQAQDLFAAVGDLSGQARLHFDLCWIHHRQGDHERSLEHARRAYDLFRAAGNQSGEARALNNMAWGHSSLGNHEQALIAGEQARLLNQEIGDRYGEADTWDVLGQARHELGRHQESIACYLRAVGLYREFGHRWAEADTLDRLGDTYLAAGDPTAADEAWHQAVETLTELRHPDAERVRAKLTVATGVPQP